MAPANLFSFGGSVGFVANLMVIRVVDGIGSAFPHRFVEPPSLRRKGRQPAKVSGTVVFVPEFEQNSSAA